MRLETQGRIVSGWTFEDFETLYIGLIAVVGLWWCIG